MSVLLTLVAGMLLALACVRWAARGTEETTRMAVVVTLGVAASAFNVVVPVPNVEATTTLVLGAALVLGLPSGMAVGVVAVVGTSVTGGVGPWTLWQVVGMCIVAVAGGLVGRVARDVDWFAPRPRVLLGLVAAVAAAVHDTFVTLTGTASLGPALGGSAVDQAIAMLLVGLPFTLVHMAWAGALTALTAPALVHALERVRVRLAPPSPAAVVVRSAHPHHPLVGDGRRPGTAAMDPHPDPHRPAGVGDHP